VFKLGHDGEKLVAVAVTCSPRVKKFPNLILHCIPLQEVDSESEMDHKLFQRWNLFSHFDRIILVEEDYDDEAFLGMMKLYLELPEKILSKPTNKIPPSGSPRTLRDRNTLVPPSRDSLVEHSMGSSGGDKSADAKASAGAGAKNNSGAKTNAGAGAKNKPGAKANVGAGAKANAGAGAKADNGGRGTGKKADSPAILPRLTLKHTEESLSKYSVVDLRNAIVTEGIGAIGVSRRTKSDCIQALLRTYIPPPPAKDVDADSQPKISKKKTPKPMMTPKVCIITNLFMLIICIIEVQAPEARRDAQTKTT
jgi:hypothetical protein